MNIWELLGIPPTTDIAKIKSAYARQAKLYHPEEHPEEFKALQGAYKMAVRIAKSQKAAVQNQRVEDSGEGKPAAGVFERESEQAVGMPKRESEQAAEASERESEQAAGVPDRELEPTVAAPEREFEQAAGMLEKESEPSMDALRRESEPQPSNGTHGGAGQEKGFAGTSRQRKEHFFDYSDVDPYGDRERFFRQFLLIAKSPYLRNNPDAWEEFLNEKEFVELFDDSDFRVNFVQTMCRQSGFRRKTILYFERHLNQFHTDQNKLADGKWETKLTCFRIKKFPRLRLPAFCMDRYWGKEGRTFHKKIWAKLSSSLGRELNFDMKADVVRYMKLYLFFGESNQATGDFIDRLHRSWVAQQVILAGGILMVCLLTAFVEINSIQQRKENENQLEYIRELYGEDAEGYSERKLMEELSNYNYGWKRAEEGLDDVLGRYESWSE